MIATVAAMALTGPTCLSAPLTYDIPRLDDISVDGNAAAWGDRGLHVDELIAVYGPQPPAALCDAQVRIGWNQTGLLVLAQVTDQNIVESDDDAALYRGASVELLLAPSRESHTSVQCIVSPGLDPNHPAIRETTQNQPSGTTTNAAPAGALFKSAKTAGGYNIEALLPWHSVGVSVRQGQEVACQVYVDDARDGAQLGWNPQTAATSDASFMNTVRLSDKPSRPIEADATAAYVRFRRVEAHVLAPAVLAGQDVEFDRWPPYSRARDA